MFTLAVVYISLLLSVVRVNAQTCDANTPCPASAPCCSEYGYCGTGSQFCLAGCNPLYSHSLDSCKPSPACQNTQYTFTDTSRILYNAAEYDGDASKHDWVIDGGNIDVQDNNLVMILTETNAGTRLSSTRFIQYGTITARLKAGRWNGVVMGFITMSNIRDEIDWEFPGDKVTEAQTNMFWQGTNSQGAVETGLTDNYQNYHDYTIDWSADALTFKIDGNTVRTLKASDLTQGGVSKFPQTPSRIQLSLWPAGTSASAPGTVQWAGGMINWNDPDFKANGNQFRVYVESISLTCATQPAGNQVSYVYGPGSTANKQTIQLSSLSPLLNDASTGSSTTASASGTASTTSATGTTTSTTTGTDTGTDTGTATATDGTGIATVTGTATGTDAGTVSATASSTSGGDGGSGVPVTTGGGATTQAGSTSSTSVPGKHTTTNRHHHNRPTPTPHHFGGIGFAGATTSGTPAPTQPAPARNGTGSPDGGFFGNAPVSPSTTVSVSLTTSMDSQASGQPSGSGSGKKNAALPQTGSSSAVWIVAAVGSIALLF